jgi:hypothetical protein
LTISLEILTFTKEFQRFFQGHHMNFALKTLLIISSLYGTLFCQEGPLRKSGVIAIPALMIELPEASSLESCATAVTSQDMSTASSAKITPTTSISPTRRDSADMEMDELLPEQKIFDRVKNSSSPEYKRVFFSALEKRLNELSEKTRAEKEQFLRQENINSPKPYYYDWPGSSSKVYTIKDLLESEQVAMPYIMSHCPYK